jgi:hypothetical protein
MSALKDNPNEPIIKKALTTRKNGSGRTPEEEANGSLEQQKNIAVNKSSGDPDTSAGDPADFDAKHNNIHQKR